MEHIKKIVFTKNINVKLRIVIFSLSYFEIGGNGHGF